MIIAIAISIILLIIGVSVGVSIEEVKDIKSKLIELKGKLIKLKEKSDYIHGEINKTNELVNSLFYYDYFYECPCCNNRENILKSEAVSFQILSNGIRIDTMYTTKESYETHKTQIKKWEKEVKQLKKNK